ncbi:hypothetical protein C8Q70DRAFT_161365 [Cubamyces menziesii]|nr:hypothetical protein C8Q70DRAFT_161365 [Cubamyces menziesii]
MLPKSIPGGIAATATFACALGAICYTVYAENRRRPRRQEENRGNRAIREQLPSSLLEWRLPPVTDGSESRVATEAAVWQPLFEFFRGHGFTLWKHAFMFMLIPDAEEPAESSSGFAYATPERGLGPGIGSVIRIFEYQALNPLCRPARTRAGFDVVIRVLAIGQSGQDHVEILNALTRGDFAFFSANHAIPLYEFITFEDITFGIFPMVGSRVEEAYGYWAKNSVGDVVDMLLQCLEALLFIHSAKIAHRDNFLVQWHPESLLIGYPSSSRPRVYLTDFETAMKFPNGTPAAECLASGIPMGSSFPEDVSRYKRPVTPDMGAGQQYDPFKLDVWQLAMSFKNFQSTIPEIDNLLNGLREPDASLRMTSADAYYHLSDILSSIPPNSLLIPPNVLAETWM